MVYKRAVFIPKSFAHGFITLEDDSHLIYFHDEFYSPEHAQTLNINDPKLNISLKEEIKVISDKDLNTKHLNTKIEL